MEKTINLRELFKESDKYIGQKISVTGWIRTNRDSKTFGFIVLSDGTVFSNLQVVYFCVKCCSKLNSFVSHRRPI